MTDAALGSNETAPNCANCATVLASAQRYCGACGQRTGRARLTMRDIGHDFLHALTHVDQSILALVKALLLRPGHVAREYVEGKRKKYFAKLNCFIRAPPERSMIRFLALSRIWSIEAITMT